MNQPKTCLTCPSFVPPGNEQRNFFGKNVGVEMCARFGKPLASLKTPTKTLDDVAQNTAKNCAEHGKPRPMSADWNHPDFLKVALPITDISSPNKQELVSSCNSCEHMVAASAVSQELGFPASMCAIKGKLLLGHRLTIEGRNCEYRSFGSSLQTTRNITLFPEYAPDFKPTGDAVKDFYAARAAGFVDPVDYVTDKEVTPEEYESGIRAWREIKDPHTDNSVHLPIYRLDFFSEREQAKVPRTGDDEHPEDYVDHNFLTYKIAVLWLHLDETPALWAQAGVGKTEFFRYMAWLMCLPFERISITGSTELDDLAGKMHYSPEKGTYWKDGRLVEAWSKPCILCVDEPNAGQPDVWQFLRPMTDNSKQLVIDQNEGEARKRNDDCYLGLAMNPAWDPKYVGAQVLSDADANRLMHVHVEMPPRKLEEEILRKACERDGYDVPNETIKTVMDIAADLRSLCDEDTLPITWGIRPQLKVARALRWFDYLSAYRMASADFLEPEAQEQLLDVVRTHMSN